MIITRERLRAIVNDMPESVEIDEIVGKIILEAKIESALEQIEKGEFLTEEEIKKETDSWN